MRIKNIKLRINGKKEILEQFAETLEKARKGESVARTEGISFATIETFRNVITGKRLELLHTIKQDSPDSIYALAKVVNRDLKSVTTDLAILKKFGLIKLKKERTERRRVKPLLMVDKIHVEIAL